MPTLTKRKPKTTSPRNKSAKTNSQANAFAASVESSQTAVMMIDRDFIVTYVNARTRKMFEEYRETFRSIWPQFNGDQIIGQSIDMFHKNPQHQRNLLSDPTRLPYKTDVRIGDLSFSLQVTAQYDAKGNYVGNTLEWADVTMLRQFQGVTQALDRSQAVIEFSLDGTILDANQNFLTSMGYGLAEIKGKHHSMFVDPKYASSNEYRTFWQELNAGKFQSGEFCRYGKNNKEIWIQASYNPITDQSGRPFKVVKYASDITETKLRNADFEGQLAAINNSQAVIQFTLDGTIITANDNFLSTVGYSLPEVQGKHHSMFVDPEHARSTEYRIFWEDLRAGRYRADQFQRFGKGGKEVWIQASYNPILDMQGRPVKVVKYATDITAQKALEREIAANQKRDAERAEMERKQAEEQQRKVQTVLGVVNSMAEGNFTVNVPDLGNDAVGQVSKALCQAIDSMRTALTEVRNVSATVASAAEQLSSASREISSGAQEQASSLEETASSLEEITSTVKQNTDNAQQARQLATGSRDVAEKGGQVVGNAVEAMGAINQASKKIADIITTIDEIAFQTNLLALNAAVEAARAGEQGRGFAVVAAEVRNLAQRSASAAKEIKTLIQDSMRKVENGTELVNKSGETLGEIVSSVKRVTDIVAEIAAASKEQLTGIEQVNKAVAQMDRVTQANASQTEEVAGTAGSLLQNAERLSELVSHFQLGGTTTIPRVPATTGKSIPATASARDLSRANTAGTNAMNSFDQQYDQGETLEF